MQIIPYYDAAVEQVAKDLSEGKVFVMPTETSYGLVADACNPEAVDKIYQIKNRSTNKPLPLIFTSLDQVLEYVHIPSNLIELGRQHWPGPLSVIGQPIDNRLKSNPAKTFGGSVAVRVTSDNFLQDLVNFYKKPLTATSANISGEESIYDFAEIEKVFSDAETKPDIIMDKGKLIENKPSTLVTEEKGKIKVLRQGEIEI